MSTFPPRPPVTERAAQATRNPVVAGIIGGLVVLVIGALLVATGVVGKEKKTTVVQAPLAGSPTTSDEGVGLTVNEVYKRDGPGVVFIRAEVAQETDSPFGLPQDQRGTATGSGFVIDKEGHVLTNAHVVDGAGKVEVSFGDDKTVDARVLGSDSSTDVAMLKVDAKKADLKPLDLGNSSKLEVGDAVIAIGNPFGLDRTVTTGIISALQRAIDAPNGFSIRNVIQTDAAINPGNSGGPLLDSLGRVIGINSQIATGGAGGGSVGIGFAVPVNTVKKVSAQLKDKGKVDHAFLGVTGVAISKSMSDNLNLPTDTGVLVQQTSGPAKKSGVRGGDTQVAIGGTNILLGGDVLTKLDGKSVKSMEDVIRIVDSKEPGDQLTLTLLRGKDQRTVKVSLGSRPANASSGFSQPGPQTPQSP